MKFKEPSIDNAVKSLRPNVITWDFFMNENTKTFRVWDDPTMTEPPTWEELCLEIHKLNAIWQYYDYARRREEMYGDIKDQLDMLYHDIKNNNLENGTWISHIEHVKKSIEKPDHPEPDVYNITLEDVN